MSPSNTITLPNIQKQLISKGEPLDAHDQRFYISWLIVNTRWAELFNLRADHTSDMWPRDDCRGEPILQTHAWQGIHGISKIKFPVLSVLFMKFPCVLERRHQNTLMFPYFPIFYSPCFHCRENFQVTFTVLWVPCMSWIRTQHLQVSSAVF